MLLYASHRIQEARARETNVSNMLCNNHKKKRKCVKIITYIMLKLFERENKYYVNLNFFNMVN